MILNDGRANKEYKDICQEPQHYARIAYVNEHGVFEVYDDGNLNEYSGSIHLTGITSQVSGDHEVLLSFFQNYHITPRWINCYYTYGWFNNRTGYWTGAVGKVKRKKNR